MKSNRFFTASSNSLPSHPFTGGAAAVSDHVGAVFRYFSAHCYTAINLVVKHGVEKECDVITPVGKNHCHQILVAIPHTRAA